MASAEQQERPEEIALMQKMVVEPLVMSTHAKERLQERLRTDPATFKAMAEEQRLVLIRDSYETTDKKTGVDHPSPRAKVYFPQLHATLIIAFGHRHQFLVSVYKTKPGRRPCFICRVPKGISICKSCLPLQLQFESEEELVKVFESLFIKNVTYAKSLVSLQGMPAKERFFRKGDVRILEGSWRPVTRGNRRSADIFELKLDRCESRCFVASLNFYAAELVIMGFHSDDSATRNENAPRVPVDRPYVLRRSLEQILLPQGLTFPPSGPRRRISPFLRGLLAASLPCAALVALWALKRQELTRVNVQGYLQWCVEGIPAVQLLLARAAKWLLALLPPLKESLCQVWKRERQ